MNRVKLFFERIINDEIDQYISYLNELRNIDNVTFKTH